MSISEATDGIAAQFGGYVQDKSKLNVSVAASGIYYSSISSYKVTVDGAVFYGQSITSGILTTSGTKTVSVTVTDSRGRTATTTRTITVLAYATQRIVSFNCSRCNASGVDSPEGTYLKAVIDFVISNVNNKNTKSWSLQYKKKGDSTWTTATSGNVYAYAGTYISTSGIISGDYAYNVRLVVSDFFSTIEKVVDIGTAFTLIDFNGSGKGIAFGKVSEKNAMEVNMDIYDRTGITVRNGIAYYQANGQADPDTTQEHLILTESKTPSGGGFYYIMTFFYQNRTGNRSQIAIPYNKNTKIYFRYCFNGTWSAWQ